MKSLHREKAKSPEQKDARRKAMSAAADAFVGEAFDARKSPMFALREERASKKVDARIGKLRAVLSVLRPDQVTRLTAIVAERRPGGDGHDEQRYESND